MRKTSRAFLESLLGQPSPSGYEGPVRKVWKAEVEQYAERVDVDVHGNAIGVCNPEGKPRVMLAGHMDELGFQVSYIDDRGYIYFNTIGGFDMGTISGRKVRIHTEGGPVFGVTGKKAVHLIEPEERGKVPKLHEMWIDIGAADGKAAKKLVAMGDPVTYDANFEVLRGDLVVSRGLDNRMGAYIAAETLRCVAQAKKKAKAGLFAVATVQEEIGLRGATTSTYGVDPLVGIGLDVTHATDFPGIDARKHGDLSVGEGPVITRGANINPVVFQRLVAVAKKNKIPHQIDAAPRGTGTDTNAMQLSRAGVATGLISVPQRYMHTPVEVLSLTDLDNAVKLLTEFVLSLDGKADFTP
ncbi:MAG: M20/M25/M40 family metallo-hydrolase [Candidatus Latescibacteria bacterium]|nr:M20/M25/M40 family metallo-hydrolase [Candidatus Latescibacterota bacterium]